MVDTLAGDLDLARRAVRSGASVAIAKAGRLLAQAKGGGVAPLLIALREAGDEARGSCVTDRVVGRAAAMIMLDAGVARVHAFIVSKPAIELFSSRKLACTFDRLVEFITDRSGKDMCPIEKLSMGRTDCRLLRMELEHKFIAAAGKE